MNTEKQIRLDIQFFADGGEGTSGTASDGTTGENVAAAVPQEAEKNVHNASAQDDIRAQYEADIKGKYKDLDNARIKDIISRRLKSSQETVAKYDRLLPVLETVAKKYGVDANNIDALMKAIDEDDYFIEEEALEKNVSTDYLRGMRQMERENSSLRRQVEAAQEQEAKLQRERQYAEWDRQEAHAKKFYPNLNIKKELENPQFKAMLASGVEVKAAYEALHMDEILPTAMQYAVKSTEDKIANKIMSVSRRADENGLSGGGASSTKVDVSKLTKAEREKLFQRAANGEEITFG